MLIYTHYIFEKVYLPTKLSLESRFSSQTPKPDNFSLNCQNHLNYAHVLITFLHHSLKLRSGFQGSFIFLKSKNKFSKHLATFLNPQKNIFTLIKIREKTYRKIGTWGYSHKIFGAHKNITTSFQNFDSTLEK
jgi:hypothetical protein